MHSCCDDDDDDLDGQAEILPDCAQGTVVVRTTRSFKASRTGMVQVDVAATTEVTIRLPQNPIIGKGFRVNAGTASVLVSGGDRPIVGQDPITKTVTIAPGATRFFVFTSLTVIAGTPGSWY